jgi:hypothetical protein
MPEGAACAQRQTEVHRAYIRRAGAGRAGAFDKLLNEIWDDIRCQQASEHDHKKWHERGEKLVPNPKTGTDIYKGTAQLAGFSLLYSNSVHGGQTG